MQLLQNNKFYFYGFLYKSLVSLAVIDNKNFYNNIKQDMRILIQTNQPYITKNRNFRSSDTVNSVPAEEALPIEDKKKNKLHIGSAITIATLLTVCGIFMISRGFQKNTNKFLNKVKDYLEKKQELSSLSASKNKNKLYGYAIRRTNSFIKKSESINNITSLKDILFMKLMYKTKPTKEIHKSISEFFEKLSRKTVVDSYTKTSKDFEKMNQVFDKLDELILKESPDEIVIFNEKEYTKQQLVKKAKNYRERANDFVTNFISENSQKLRYEYINDVTKNLYSRFWDVSFKDFWSKDNKFKRKEMWQTFIAAEQIKGDKTKLAEWAATARNAITYTNADKTGLIHDYINNLDGIIPADDTKGIDIIKKLEWFAKNSEGLKNNKELFLAELEKLKEHKIVSSDENLAKTQEEFKASNIQLIEDLLDDTATGEIQDMLSIYYKLAPFELDKSGASLAVKKAVQSFDKSVNYECIEFFDKIRDLRLGSAPTDVLTILFSFITLSLGLGHAKNKEKQQSVMLQSGIPIVGGIAVSTLSATKLVAGGKSLALGFISGLALNQIGKVVDNIWKQYKN